MYIESVRVGKFRHIQAVELGPLPAPFTESVSIVLAGPNGGGKSSILELIGYGMSNAWSLSWALHRNFPEHSFEITMGLNDEDCNVIDRWLVEAEPPEADVEVARRLIDKRRILRGFNYPDGDFQKNTAEYNQLFRIATIALKDHYQRSIGFFLKPDRAYPPKTFEQRKVLQFDSLRGRSQTWNVAYNTSELQYQDMYDYLVQRRYHFLRELGGYHHKKELGHEVAAEPPFDPLAPYEDLLGRLFPGYRFAPVTEEIPQDLFVQLDAWTTLPFRDLSSGEKEVFFILASMLRHEVENAIIAIDEPELHLHPELARTLIRELQGIKSGNQIWLATHNPEIIDEVGRDNVYYVSREQGSARAVVASGRNEPEADRILRDLFGFSGFIGVGRAIVFLEGTESSADRKVFGQLITGGAGRVKLVPAGGVSELTRLNQAVLKLLESDVAHVTYYLVRDRDYLNDEQIHKYNNHQSGRLRVLKRNQIENYLLVHEAIVRVASRIYDIEMTEADCERALRAAAESISAEVVVGLARAEVATRWQPEEVIPARFLRGESALGSDARSMANRAKIESALISKATAITADLSNQLSADELSSIVAKSVATAEEWLNDGRWKERYPGRRILEAFASQNSLSNPIVLTNSIIRELASDPALINDELKRILRQAADGEDQLSE